MAYFKSMSISDRHKSIITLSMTLFGASILLTAWCAQSIFQSKFAAQRAYLEKTQLLNEINQSELAYWKKSIVTHELQESIPAYVVASDYYEYCRLSHKMLSHQYVRNTFGQDASAITYKNIELSILKSALQLTIRHNVDDAKKILAGYQKMSLSEYSNFVDKEAKSAKNSEYFGKHLRKLTFPSNLTEAEKNEAVYGLVVLIMKFDDVVKLKENSIKDMDDKYFSLMASSKDGESTWTSIFILAYIIGSLLIGAKWMLVNVFYWPGTLIPMKHDTQAVEANE